LDYWERGGFLNDSSTFKITSEKYEQSLAGDWKMNIGKLNALSINSPCVHPNLLYNGMLHPILPYSFKGAIWYQGENNEMFGYSYRGPLKALICDWRSNFISGNFPFYVVQVPNYNSFNNNSQSGGSNWADLRESQSIAQTLPNVGMVVTYDLGDSTDIHPKNKTELARRLTLLILKKTYGQGHGEVNSPVFSRVKFDGNRSIITFKNTGAGLVAKNRYGYVAGFEVAGADKIFHWAKAEIDGNKVMLTSAEVTCPVAVRYAWSDNPDANLYNREGFPAAPFRTDDWELVTQKEKYGNWIR